MDRSRREDDWWEPTDRPVMASNIFEDSNPLLRIGFYTGYILIAFSNTISDKKVLASEILLLVAWIFYILSTVLLAYNSYLNLGTVSLKKVSRSWAFWLSLLVFAAFLISYPFVTIHALDLSKDSEAAIIVITMLVAIVLSYVAIIDAQKRELKKLRIYLLLLSVWRAGFKNSQSNPT